jgi:integrase
LRKVERTSGTPVWEYRYRDNSQPGSPLRQKTLSTVEYPTKAKALEALAPLVLKVNGRTTFVAEQKPTLGLVLDKFIESERLKEIVENTDAPVDPDALHYSTAVSYLSMIERHIRPRWGRMALDEIEPHDVQKWLQGLTVVRRVKGSKTGVTVPMAAKTKGHLKQFMHRLFSKAMYWRFVPREINPISLVELRGVTRRRKRPMILTPEQYHALLGLLIEPYRSMVIVALSLGLRVSELLALKWSDFDFDALTVSVERGVVNGRVSDTKTEGSTEELPLDESFAALVEEWQQEANSRAEKRAKEGLPNLNSEGWVFANQETGKPFHASTIQQDYLRPAGRQIGLGDGLGWHTFRHSYRALLDATGAPVGVQQRLMRHANVATTMNVYGGAYMNEKREAHGKVVQMLLPKEKATTAMAAS